MASANINEGLDLSRGIETVVQSLRRPDVFIKNSENTTLWKLENLIENRQHALTKVKMQVHQNHQSQLNSQRVVH